MIDWVPQMVRAVYLCLRQSTCFSIKNGQNSYFSPCNTLKSTHWRHTYNIWLYTICFSLFLTWKAEVFIQRILSSCKSNYTLVQINIHRWHSDESLSIFYCSILPYPWLNQRTINSNNRKRPQWQIKQQPVKYSRNIKYEYVWFVTIRRK